MNISSCSPISFKGYVPVRYMAKDSETGGYFPILDKANIRKCHSFVVRNLNGTAKNQRNDEFIKYYKSYDKDYARVPAVHSIYDKDSPVVYMVTGSDTDHIGNLARPVGQAKGYALEKTGRAASYESKYAARNFFRQVKAFLNNSCKRVKDSEGRNVSLVMYFDPKFSKNDRFIGFQYESAEFVVDQ